MDETSIEMPAQQRTRFFRDQLNLTVDQIDIFRELNRNYNRKAQRITMELEELRIGMVEELGEENPDSIKINSLSTHIGDLHAELKQATISYYLAMKRECDEEQQLKLNELFMSALKKKEDVSLPRRGKGFRGNFNK